MKILKFMLIASCLVIITNAISGRMFLGINITHPLAIITFVLGIYYFLKTNKKEETK